MTDADSTPAPSIPFEPERSYFVRTGATHLFQLPADWLTIVFVLESAGEVATEFPKYVLRSTDGVYEQELSAKNDLVPGDAWLQLRFEKMIPGKRYTLTCFDDAKLSRVVFDDLPFAAVVDQPRPMHEALAEHGYGEFDLAQEDGTLFDEWKSEEEDEEVA